MLNQIWGSIKGLQQGMQRLQLGLNILSHNLFHDVDHVHHKNNVLKTKCINLRLLKYFILLVFFYFYVYTPT